MTPLGIAYIRVRSKCICECICSYLRLQSSSTSLPLKKKKKFASAFTRTVLVCDGLWMLSNIVELIRAGGQGILSLKSHFFLKVKIYASLHLQDLSSC